MHNAKLKFAALGLVLFAACKDKAPVAPVTVTPKVAEVNAPASRLALANTAVTPNVVVKVTGADGKAVAGATVFFSIAAGGGTLTGNATVTTDANGQATSPVWTLGKSATGQTLRAISGTMDPLDISATVITGYGIVVRPFGSTPMSPSQLAIFQNAARRIMGVVTGDLADVQLSNTDISSCAAGVSPLTEVIDDLVIYAESKPIDGVGNVLGSSRPCFVRVSGPNCATGCVNLPVIGMMSFDSADLDNLEQTGKLQDVITHEMLHVLGIGSLWNTFGLLTGSGGADPRFTGASGTSGCQNTGGTITCASSVPVENTGPTGTRDAHWREATFDNELMTGYLNNGTNPMSLLTIKSLSDFGYTVNNSDNDTYSIPGGLVIAGSASAQPVVSTTSFDRIAAGPLFGISLRSSKITFIRNFQ